MESILSLDVENENYLVYYQQNDDYILPACQKFAKNLHRAVIESPQGFKLATQIDILKAVLGDERLNLNISEFFKENLKSSLELISIRSGTSLQKALGEMMESNLPCLPVLDDGKLIGCLCPLAVSRLDPKHFKEQLLAPVDDLVKGLVSSQD